MKYYRVASWCFSFLIFFTLRYSNAFFLSWRDQDHHIDKFRMKHLEAMKDKDNHFALEMARINADLEKTKMELSKNMMMKDWLLAVLAILLCLVLLSPSKSDLDIMDVCKMLVWSLMSVCIWETFWISLSNMLCTQSCTAKMPHHQTPLAHEQKLTSLQWVVLFLRF